MRNAFVMHIIRYSIILLDEEWGIRPASPSIGKLLEKAAARCTMISYLGLAFVWITPSKLDLVFSSRLFVNRHSKLFTLETELPAKMPLALAVT